MFFSEVNKQREQQEGEVLSERLQRFPIVSDLGFGTP